MDSGIHKIKWLFDVDLPPSKIGGDTKEIQFPYPPELGQGYSNHYNLIDGITLIKSTHQFFAEDRPHEIKLSNFKINFPSSCFIVQIMHSGSLNYYCNITKKNSYRVCGYDIFSRYEALDIDQTVYTDEDISYSILMIPDNQIYKLFGPEIAEIFYKILGLDNVLNSSEFNIPNTISIKIANCLPDQLEGNMRTLFAHSIVLQYLIELNLHMSSSRNFLDKLEINNFDVTDLHFELLQVTTNIPTLSDIAKKYNISPLKLNQSFTKKYNQTIYSFLSNQRLEQAHQALINTSIPMKTLAHKIGYSHVNHFITAFKNKFGVTPGSIRK